MPSFKFGQPTTNAYAQPSTVTGSVRVRGAGPATSQIVTADSTGEGGSSYTNNRYNSVWDRLDQGSVLEDWIPRDAAGINKMFRLIHLRDAVAGPTVDHYASLPWSEHDVTGIKDPAIRRFYEEAHAMFTPEVMTSIAKEFLIIGRYCASLAFNPNKGYFDDFATHDPDFLDIVPVPFRGHDPIIDLRATPTMRNFMTSQDDRIKRIRALVPRAYIERFNAGGKMPLEPLSTLFLARRISANDSVGTSMLTRVVGAWAIEKALMDATVTAARRRVGAIMHVTAGIDGIWEPDATELDNIAALFVQAEEDPVGAVVATRNGVNVSEPRAGGQVWKVSDEWANLVEMKMRALGVSDAFLSGDSTFSNMETARSILMEQILYFRMQLTQQLFGKIDTTLARAHGFVNDPKRANTNGQIRVAPDLRRDMEMQSRRSPYAYAAQIEDSIDDAAFRRRLAKTLSLDKALRIPTEQLVVPTVHWRKDMKPTQDEAYLALLEKMEEKGLPIPKRIWAAAGGYDLDAAIEMMEEDKTLTKKIAELGGEGAEGAEGPDGMDLGGPGGDLDLGPESGPGPGKEPPELDDLSKDLESLDKLAGGPPGAAPKPGSGPIKPEKPPAAKEAKPNPITHPAPPSEMKPQRNPLAFVRRMQQDPIWRDDQFLGLKRGVVLAMAEKVERHADSMQDPAELRALLHATIKKTQAREVAAFCCRLGGLPVAMEISTETSAKIAEALVGQNLEPAALVERLVALGDMTGRHAPVEVSTKSHTSNKQPMMRPNDVHLIGGLP